MIAQLFSIFSLSFILSFFSDLIEHQLGRIGVVYFCFCWFFFVRYLVFSWLHLILLAPLNIFESDSLISGPLCARSRLVSGPSERLVLCTRMFNRNVRLWRGSPWEEIIEDLFSPPSGPNDLSFAIFAW